MSTPSINRSGTNTEFVLSSASGAARLHRFPIVLGDLGVAGTVGRNWISFEDGAFRFADLKDRVADVLLHRP